MSIDGFGMNKTNMISPKRLLVITDSHFIEKNGIFYTELQSDSSFWQRYLDVFDELIILGRIRKAVESDDLDQYLVSSRQGVRFLAIPEFVGVQGLASYWAEINKRYDEALDSVDAIIARTPGTILAALWWKIKSGMKPFAAEVVVNPSTAFLSEKNSLIGKLSSRFFTWMTRDICKNADGVSYVTSRVLQQQFPSGRSLGDMTRFESWYSTIDISDSFYIDQRERNKPSCITVAFSGQMNNLRKGQDIFLRTISILNERGVPVKAIMVGDGGMRPYLSDLADSLGLHDSIVFSGWIAGTKRVQRYISKADFFLLPSLSEGLPRCMIEAMASSVLCICSGADGMSELVDGCCIVSDNSPSHYADVIQYFWENWEEYSSELANQFATARQFNSSNMRARRKSFYSELLARTCKQKQ